MQAFILSGGKGTRLKSVLGDRPKALAPFRGRVFLDWQLAWIESFGIRKITLALGVGSEQVTGFLKERTSLGSRPDWVIEETPLGTGGAIRFVAASEESTFLAINGDTLAELDFKNFALLHKTSGATVSIACYQVEDAGARGRVDFDDSGAVTSFREKSGGGAAWVSGGIYLCEPEIMQAIPEEGSSSLEENVFPQLLSEGKRVTAYGSPGRFYDIGTPTSLAVSEKEWDGTAAGRRP